MEEMIFDDKNFVKELNEKLHKGGVISFVTDTVWGVGCLPDSHVHERTLYVVQAECRADVCL